ncbi:uncharacterized protein [Physcomitrium patens]|uniref:GrpE protein homolog n=1 Tax=Physcomitrium patens TaxID=3218 RepID=D2XNF6_PHYPA|nr:uncharacterized protein LOC112280935 [Physcomitrium patens]ADB23408.1 chloroplast CGE2 [Physcomitrium patens]PNR54839.1 hypothetical protein PHYPA_005732 [Physcomitrium patens]|eukprot:XP_024372666.1 uncharacterized protein LOC112280935 [Physcomitrella patens]
MPAVACTAAMAGTLIQAPRQSIVVSRMASARAFVPAQFGAQCFRWRGVVQVQSFRYRRLVFVARNSAQTDAKKTEEVAEKKGEAQVDNVSEASAAEETSSSIKSLLEAYREAVAVNDEEAITDVESQLEAIAIERDSLAENANALIGEVSTNKDRYIRLNADFDNYRKRSERDRLATAGNIRGEVVESLLPIVDNFERAKTSIKTETEGEQKIDNAYQSIYKQFVEIMKSLGVVAIETVGKSFDPNLHEAIMREDSTEFAEDIVSQEFRRGFRIEDRLLRPAMVKVSSGPGPAADTDLPIEESLANE